MKRKILIKFYTKENADEFNKLFGTWIDYSSKVLYYPEMIVKLKSNANVIIKNNFKEKHKVIPEWRKLWVDMPYFNLENLYIYCTLELQIDEDKVQEFAKKINQNITPKTKEIKFPYVKEGFNATLRMRSKVTNKFPIYIVSKSRWDDCRTALYLRDMGADFKIIVEKDQYDNYNKNFAKENLLILPEKYLDEYETYDNLGRTKSTGPGAARNFAWDHSISEGHEWHWVMDDNILGFYWISDNKRIKFVDSGIFRPAEEFVQRYDNIAISGLNYYMFVVPTVRRVPIGFNTRIYSCLLIRNDIPYRWQGRYNEDTDICLRVLKDGWSTAQFNASLCDKLCTQTIGGGNSTEFYSKEGTMPKSFMLEAAHPDVAKVTWKYGRWHHHVDYSVFADNKLGNKLPYEPLDFGFETFRISKEDHESWNDSKKYLYKKYFNEDVPDETIQKGPSRYKLKNTKKTITIQKGKAAKKSDTDYAAFVNEEIEDPYKVLVQAPEDFDNKYLAEKILKDKGITEIVNTCIKPIDEISAIWGYHNNINIKDFLPDINKYSTEIAYQKIYSEIVDYIDYAIIFWDNKDTIIKNLIKNLEDKNIPYELHFVNEQEEIDFDI